MRFNFAGIIANYIMPLDRKYTTRLCLWKRLSTKTVFRFYLIFGLESIVRIIIQNLMRKKYKKTKRNLCIKGNVFAI